MLIDYVERNRAFIRTIVQFGWALLAGWGPVQWALDQGGWDVSSDNVEAFVFLLTLGVIRFVGGWLEKLPAVTGNSTLRHLVGILMGGEVAPEYKGAAATGE